MAAEFGGTPYKKVNGVMQAEPTQGGLKGMWQAFIPGGFDASDGEYHNVAGNMLGSWVFRINYDADSWKLGFYGDHFFEDHSAMFFLDYDGYGTGDQWNTHTKRRYYRYKLKDMLLGLELNLKYGTWLLYSVFLSCSVLWKKLLSKGPRLF